METNLYILATDGSFYNNGASMVCPSPKTNDVKELFWYEVFKLMRTEGKISDAVIENGRLKILDDPEVREEAAKYGDPDYLLTEKWIPEMPPRD